VKRAEEEYPDKKEEYPDKKEEYPDKKCGDDSWDI